MISRKVQVFTDSNSWCDLAIEFINLHFPNNVEVIRGGKGDKLPEGLGLLEYDIIISFLSPFIIPKHVLNKSTLSVNFHPGTSNYPGTGCYNFALYEESDVYGAVCHHMEPSVDTGKIIEEDTFQVFVWDTVESLQFRSYISLIKLLSSFLSRVVNGDDFNINNIEWLRKPFTRKQLEELSTITVNMDKVEINKRIRATSYPGHPPKSDIDGHSFTAEENGRLPLAFRIFK